LRNLCSLIAHKRACKYTTVETRNFEVAWFDIPVTSISFWKPELFYYIINVNKIACLDIQSFDMFSHSMSIHGPNTTFYTLRLTHFPTLLSQRCEKQRVSFNNRCSIKACVKRAQSCERLINDYRVTVAID